LIRDRFGSPASSARLTKQQAARGERGRTPVRGGGRMAGKEILERIEKIVHPFATRPI
jgi:hypothetical protein